MGPTDKHIKELRTIIHLDMDAFYASVEMLDNPDYRNRPVIVGGTSNRGVVSAASYEARKFGIHSAMPIIKARQLCPQGIFLPVRMNRYREISDQIFTIYLQFTPLMEPLSLDEAFLDVTGSVGLFGSGEVIARKIKHLVRQETGLTVSGGVATNKLLAKIGSDLNKPDGLTIAPAGEERKFLAPLPIDKLWGVGRVAGKNLAMLGVQTIGDLARLPLAILERKFGKQGLWLHQASLGIDHRPVEPERPTKSIGHEETFAVNLIDPAIICQELLALASKVGQRLRRHGLAGRTVTLKIKYHDFTLQTRSTTLKNPTTDDREIFALTRQLLNKTEAGKKTIRLLGVSLSNLSKGKESIQLELFSGDQQHREKRTRINTAVDSIHDRFGGKAIQPGTLLKK